MRQNRFLDTSYLHGIARIAPGSLGFQGGTQSGSRCLNSKSNYRYDFLGQSEVRLHHAIINHNCTTSDDAKPMKLKSLQ